MPRRVRVKIITGETIEGVFNPSTGMIAGDRGTCHHVSEVTRVLEGSLD